MVADTEAGHNQEAKKESISLFGQGKAFGTPKPERLLERIIHLATNEGDLVLDSFAGSGTTGAVAHKMHRKWIMVELGDHCKTHCHKRLKKVVDGKDQLPLSEKLNWTGGSGFRYFNLAPSLLEKDFKGNWIFNKNYDANMLSAAVCKHEGFIFRPHETEYWKQGFSTEKDFIFVTTQFLTVEHIGQIHSRMKPDESLLICAKSFRAKAEDYSNITIKKIPKMLLGRCEFGREDYSLNITEEQQEMDL
tara:strand:+ start:52 stop:795 length:744 start_codon:yes stop_codon:yes gene_type:complete